jgi:hypothetical protein
VRRRLLPNRPRPKHRLRPENFRTGSTRLPARRRRRGPTASPLSRAGETRSQWMLMQRARTTSASVSSATEGFVLRQSECVARGRRAGRRLFCSRRGGGATSFGATMKGRTGGLESEGSPDRLGPLSLTGRFDTIPSNPILQACRNSEPWDGPGRGSPEAHLEAGHSAAQDFAHIGCG